MVLRRAASCRLSVRLPCICKRTAYSRNSQLDHVERVHVEVVEVALDVGHVEDRGLLVGERAVLVVLEGDVPGLRGEGLLEEGVRADAVDRGAALGVERELRGVGIDLGRGHGDLAARDGERHVDHVRGGFPEQEADLVVEGHEFARLGDEDAVAQAVEDLRAVVLRVAELEGPGLMVGFRLGAPGLGMRVGALVAHPLAGEPPVWRRILLCSMRRKAKRSRLSTKMLPARLM